MPVADDVTLRRAILCNVRDRQKAEPDYGLCSLVRAASAGLAYSSVKDRERVETQVLAMLFTLIGRFPLAGRYLYPEPHTPSGQRMRRRAVLAACRIAEADYRRLTAFRARLA